MPGTRTKSHREKAWLYRHQDTTAGPPDFRKVQTSSKDGFCYYSRKCRWHRPKPSKIKFIRSTDIRINRKSEVSYKVNSESGAFHRWMHLNTWALMKHTHLPRLHQLTQRGEKEGRALSTKHFSAPAKPETNGWQGNAETGKPQGALFSWFLFS